MNKYRLTESQFGMYLYNQFFKVPAQINPCGSVIIDEVLDFAKLKEAINTYVEKNEGTRIRICNTLLGPRQYIEEYKPLNIKTIEINDESDIKKIENRYSNYRFKLTKEKLFKVELFKLKDGRGGLVGCFNHIISDGWSMEIALRDIIKLYKGEIKEYNPGSYIKHLESEQEYLLSNRCKKDKEFWIEETKKLSHPKAGYIPYDKHELNNRSMTHIYKIDKKLINKIREYCKGNKVTEYSFFTAIFNLYVSKVSKCNEFIIQMISSNRKNQEEKNTFGPFFDGSYYPAKINNMNIIDYIKEVNGNLFKYHLHSKCPVSFVSKLLKKKGIKGFVASRIYFSYMVMKSKDDKYKKKCKINWAPMKGTYLFDILINIHDIENTGNLFVVINFLSNRYKKETIDNICFGMEKIINQTLKDDKVDIGSIEV